MLGKELIFGSRRFEGWDEGGGGRGIAGAGGSGGGWWWMAAFERV